MANTETQKQLHFMIPAAVHVGLGQMAARAKMALSAYAQTLLVAAYSARVKPPSGDRDLDAAVGRVVLLWGGGLDTVAIATAVGLTEPTVVRILDAWRSEVGMRPA